MVLGLTWSRSPIQTDTVSPLPYSARHSCRHQHVFTTVNKKGRGQGCERESSHAHFCITMNTMDSYMHQHAVHQTLPQPIGSVSETLPYSPPSSLQDLRGHSQFPLHSELAAQPTGGPCQVCLWCPCRPSQAQESLARPPPCSAGEVQLALLITATLTTLTALVLCKCPMSCVLQPSMRSARLLVRKLTTPCWEEEAFLTLSPVHPRWRTLEPSAPATPGVPNDCPCIE